MAKSQRKLTDTQLVILSAAAARDNGAVLPLPSSLTGNKGAIASVVKGLLRKGLIAEQPAAVDAETWRRGENGERIALAITVRGLEAIGVTPEAGQKGPPAPLTARADDTTPAAKSGKASTGASRPAARSGTKLALLIDLLKRKEGASLDEAAKATGWQAHSVRGALSGTIKKKLGFRLESTPDSSGTRRYRIIG